MPLRIKLIFALIFTGIINPLLSQTEKKQSLSLSFCPATIYSISKDQSKYMYGNNNTKGKEYEAIFGNYGYKAVGYDTYYYGAWEVSYKRVLTGQFQFNLGAGCELSSKHWDLYDIPDGPRIKRIMDYRFFLMPGFDYLLYNHTHSKFRFSSQAGVTLIHRGLEYFDNNERDKQQFAWQFWCVYNRKINNNLWFDWGVGYGTLGIAKIGISHCF